MRPYQDRPAGAAIDQANASQDQRAHDALAQICLDHDQRSQRVGLNDQKIHVTTGIPIYQRGSPGKLRHFPTELPGADFHDKGTVAQSVATTQSDASC